VTDVRRVFAESLAPKQKSFVWWSDDPWAALLALAAIIVLLAIVGIVVLVFTHARYVKFIQQLRAYQASYENENFAEPPGFLREYETQSLNMYVPPPDYGEVRMTLGGEGSVAAVEHTGHDPRVAAAINPIYTGEGTQTLGGASTSHVTHTTTETRVESSHTTEVAGGLTQL